MSEKSDLLGKLKIDRTPEAPKQAGIRPFWVGAVTLLAAAGTGLAVYHYFPREVVVEVAAKTPRVNTQSSTSGSQTDAQSAPPSTSLEPPKPAAGDRILNASGYITARRMATVSAEIMGLITNVTVEEGMEVEQGQVLAKLDDALATVDLEQAEAQVEVLKARKQRIRANLAEAQRVLKRAAVLRDEEFSSEASVTSAQANVDSLRADMASTEADIRVAQLAAKRQRERLADHTIRAPFGGIVTVKNAQPGEIVAPTSAGGGFTRTGICTIVDMASLEIEVDVNEAYIGRVQAGQRVEANLDAYPDWSIPASVIAIIPTADRAKATVRVRIRIEEDDSRILPDMGVKVAFLKS